VPAPGSGGKCGMTPKLTHVAWACPATLRARKAAIANRNFLIIIEPPRLQSDLA
jgi:hypothetical protein